MSISSRTFVRALTFLLAAILLTACLRGMPDQPGTGGNPTPTPTLALAGGDAAFGLLHYEYHIDQGEVYSMSAVQEIPFNIWMAPAEPKAQTIITGNVEGIETVTVQGVDQGNLCAVTSTYVVQYTIMGVFTPEDGCKVILNVEGTGSPDKITTTMTCSALPPGFDPVVLFVAPYSGPFEFVMPYQSITVHPYSQENVATAELVHLVTPVAIGCTYP